MSDRTFIEFWDGPCREHGGLSHAAVHEAGHAVVAVVLGIPFVEVSVNGDPREHPQHAGRIQGGGVVIDPDILADIVCADPVGTLPFFLAGSTAEQGAFGHVLERGYETDLRLWRQFANLLEEQDEETLEAALGQPFVHVVRATEQLLEEHSSWIGAVARALGTQLDCPLSAAEVRSLATVKSP